MGPVRDGQVEKDRPLFTIEAMKMQTVVRAPRSGRIARLALRAGSRVDTGDLVLELA